MQKSKRLSKQIVAFAVIVVTLLIVALFWLFPMAGFYVLSLFIGESFGEVTFTVQSSDDDRPILTYDQSKIDYRRHPFISINIYEILPSNPEYDPDHPRTVWWLLEDDDEWNKPLLSLTYGKCPRGFRQKIPPKPLLVGHYYHQEGTSDVIKKLGPKRYEVIPYSDFTQATKDGRIHDPSPEPSAK